MVFIRQILAMLDQLLRSRLVTRISAQHGAEIGARNIEMARRGADITVVSRKSVNHRVAVEMPTLSGSSSSHVLILATASSHAARIHRDQIDG
jgi:hypothetical protein